MQTDRTTKILLGLIAAGLWGLLLQPFWRPVPAVAAAPQDVRIVGVGDPLAVATTSIMIDDKGVLTTKGRNPEVPVIIRSQ